MPNCVPTCVGTLYSLRDKGRKGTRGWDYSRATASASGLAKKGPFYPNERVANQLELAPERPTRGQKRKKVGKVFYEIGETVRLPGAA